MSTYNLLALTPVTATGRDAKNASETARTALDNAHQLLDDTTPAADLETGPTTLLDRGALTGLLQLIRDDAHTAINGGGSSRAALHRIRRNAEQLLTALGEKNGADSWDEPLPADPQLLKFIDAAIIRALDLSLDINDPAQRAQIGDWVAKARDAKDTRNAEEIRRLLATPYLQDGSRS